MSFIEEITGFFSDSLSPYRLLMLKNGAYVEGVKSVELLTKEQVILNLSGKKLSLEGINLTVKKYAQGDVCISGEISKAVIL